MAGTYSYGFTASGCSSVQSPKPHAVWYASGYSYAYDCNGNMTSAPLPGTVISATEIQYPPVSGGANYPNNNFTLSSNSIPTTGAIKKVYYRAGAQLIAMRVITDGGSVLRRAYLHSDHLGSASLTTDANGGVVARQLYDAWGNVRYGGGMPTDIGYTGQRLDAATGGLMFYGARYYSPYLNRFISADTIVPGAGNPQSLNRYSYVNNSPLNHVDPSGHCPKDDKLCEIIVKEIKDRFGVILQDDTAIWQAWEARWVEDVLDHISDVFGAINGLTWEQKDASDALVKSIWDGVTMVRMHQTTNPFGNFSWVPPGHGGKRIEVPDHTDQNVWWSDERKTKNTIAEELAHSWDFKGALLGGWDGGRFSKGLVSAIGTDAGGCFTYLICGWDDYNTGYNPGREKPVSKHAAFSPVEDWGGSFAQFMEPRPDFDPVSPLRAQYIRVQIALLVSHQ